MSVLTVKPHRLNYLVEQSGYEDENGDYHEGQSMWEGNLPCDAVPSNGQSSEREFEDGVTRSYSYVVYMKSDVKRFYVGEKVRITFLNGVEREFDVKGFQRYQLQCKLWV